MRQQGCARPGRCAGSRRASCRRPWPSRCAAAPRQSVRRGVWGQAGGGLEHAASLLPCFFSPSFLPSFLFPKCQPTHLEIYIRILAPKHLRVLQIRAAQQVDLQPALRAGGSLHGASGGCRRAAGGGGGREAEPVRRRRAALQSHHACWREGRRGTRRWSWVRTRGSGGHTSKALVVRAGESRESLLACRSAQGRLAGWRAQRGVARRGVAGARTAASARRSHGRSWAAAGTASRIPVSSWLHTQRREHEDATCDSMHRQPGCTTGCGRCHGPSDREAERATFGCFSLTLMHCMLLKCALK